MSFKAQSHATPIDLSGLKQLLSTQKELDLAEAASILTARQTLFSKRLKPDLTWLTPYFLKRIHKSMFQKVWDWAGKWRKTQTNIGLLPHQIPEATQNLCLDLLIWTKDYSPVELATRIHHRLVYIHPFENGNGRHARLIGDLVLHSYDHHLPNWPYELGKKNLKRLQYIAALKAADQGDLQPLLNLTTIYGARKK